MIRPHFDVRVHSCTITTSCALHSQEPVNTDTHTHRLDHDRTNAWKTCVKNRVSTHSHTLTAPQDSVNKKNKKKSTDTHTHTHGCCVLLLFTDMCVHPLKIFFLHKDACMKQNSHIPSDGVRKCTPDPRFPPNGIIPPKMTLLSSFTLPQVIPKLHAFLSDFIQNKRCRC